MARPKKKPHDSRAKIMQVRVQEGEYTVFRAAAKAAGLELSGWVRQQLLLAAKRDKGKYS
jgi:hypothetical protein